MTQNDISSVVAKIPSLHCAPLGELSQNDVGLACLPVASPCSELSAVKFDDVKRDWYDCQFFHQVRSCDALYKHNERYYLIEFKTGKPKPFDLHRKLYDSVIGLVEHSVLSLEECRGKVQFLIVSLQYAPCQQHTELLHHFEAFDKEPWDYSVTRQSISTWDDHDIRKLTGFLVEKIFKLSPADFERFAQNRNWSN